MMSLLNCFYEMSNLISLYIFTKKGVYLFFAGLGFLTTLFCFKSYDLMIEWTIKARRTKEHVDMGDYVV